MVISNYETVENLAETSNAAIFKAYHRREPDRPLILKLLKATGLTDDQKAHFRQRIEHLKVLKDRNVIVPTTFGEENEVCFITRDYFDGIPLDKVIRNRPIPLTDFFAIACQLTRTLARVHDAGVVHGGLKPHNVLIDFMSFDIRLVDFISAVDVRQISHFVFDSSFIRDTLAYTSPEQTGRINHRVGFASDLYSLGILFYEMLTGRLPFAADDPLEMVHSHLAREAMRAHEVNLSIPVALSNIVAKLMVKQPEKRYQSCSGLLSDLIRCRDEFSAIGTIREFPLDTGLSRRVTFISKMVGRDKEAQVILEEYEHVARGAFRALLISGLSGIGKTRLIQELQKPIVKHRGYFTSGKFDLYQRNIPYSSLIQALKNLVRTFLTESDDRLVVWKTRILGAVGRNGKVLTDVLPELANLIGPQPGVRALPPVESLNRFHDVFDRFLACLATEETPLTVFIDDLQWCDVASFEFLTSLLSRHQDHPYLFLLGAYRHNEVDPSHPLSKLIRTAAEASHPLREIRLEPLTPQYCHEMVSYILDSPRQQTRALSDFISALSEGTPLFISESLSYLYNENLLHVDSQGQWRWDLDRIRQSRMPTTLVDLFRSKIQRLPPELSEILEYCACIGNMFSPAEVADIRGISLLDTFEILKPALSQGLLTENKTQLQFIHDRVQEAVLCLMPDIRRRQIHREIGDYLTSAIPAGTELEKLDNLFTIVAHMNLAKEETLEPDFAYSLSDLNYFAGNKALDSLATEAANEYFKTSRSLLPDDCWENPRYERTFRIFQKTAKTELMCGNYVNSEKLLTQLLGHARSDLDKAECLAEQTTSLSSIGNFIKAIETANRGLAYFQKAIPEDPEEAGRRRKQLMEEISSKGTGIWDTILNMPFTDERGRKIELAFYSELIPDLYMSGLVPQLYLSAAQSTQHCLAGGMDESVIYSFSIMGLQLGEQGEFEPAFKYEDLARDLSAKYPNTFGATRGMNGIVWCNMHSRSHPAQIVDYCLKAIQSGKNCGDLYNAGLSYGPLMWNLQVQGLSLPVLEDAARECLQFSKRYHLAFSVGLAEAVQAGWIDPMKKRATQIPIQERLRQWEADNHIASAGSYFVLRALAHYYLGEHEPAGECLAAVEKYLHGLTDNVLKRQWYVFRVLNRLSSYDQGAAGREDLRAEIRSDLEKIEVWAALGPLLKPYLALLRAVLEKVTGNLREARSLYLDAIDLAHRESYVFLEAYLNECLGELLLSLGQHPSGMYLAEAARLYRKCCAAAKEAALLEKYPELFEESTPQEPPIEASASSLTLPNLDVEYLLKASLSISSEKERDALLMKIMNVVMESSGAEHGYLLTSDGGRLFVRAESHVTDKITTRALYKPLDEATGICKAIVRYVFRTGERVILNHASQEGEFKDNPDVQFLQMRSVLCLPIVTQSSLMGILCLENRLVEGAFTGKKSQGTELLMLLAAICVENSRLADELVKVTDGRTAG